MSAVWGVAFEVLFKTGQQWQEFRDLPAVCAALDAVLDPVNGLLIYRGRGGGQMPANRVGRACAGRGRSRPDLRLRDCSIGSPSPRDSA
jgi:hypothetical protein